MRSSPSRYQTIRKLAVAAMLGVTSACALVLPPPDVKIGTGNLSSTEYPLGGSICRLFNLDVESHGSRCVARPSDGPLANADALRVGGIDIGILPSDVLADALGGVGAFSGRGPNTELRKMFVGYADAFTIVAHRELGILNADGLRGKRINLGSPGSGERIAMERIMAALGVSEAEFAEVHQLKPAEQYRAFCANELDAIIYEVAHPNGLIQAVLQTCGGVLVDFQGPKIDEMLRQHPEYERTVIQGGVYPGVPDKVQTVGVQAIVVTTSRFSEELAYEITKAVFQNVTNFRIMHPAFSLKPVAEMVSSAANLPIHPGAIRYYRERGWLP